MQLYVKKYMTKYIFLLIFNESSFLKILIWNLITKIINIELYKKLCNK